MPSAVSIFNDVIGPVMRGASSSHCAAALRIGRLARDLMGGDITDVLIEFDTNGSLPNTHESQGSDIADARLKRAFVTNADEGGTERMTRGWGLVRSRASRGATRLLGAEGWLGA